MLTECGKIMLISRQAVCMWERDERIPNVNTLIKIAKTFGVSLDRMVNGKLISQNSNSEENG